MPYRRPGCCSRPPPAAPREAARIRPRDGDEVGVRFGTLAACIVEFCDKPVA
jgi:hypothetical protein